MPARPMYIYILASSSGVLYTGVTNDLLRRVHQHRSGLVAGFTRQYRVWKLVWWEEAHEPRVAIVREKEIKGWRRSRPVELIEQMNPGWQNLAADWFRA
ncbi:MAG: GIY-YIG nuclease family protein [Gemmatimonadales bacterium]